MEIYWTVEKAIANAEVFAEEFSNRQILLYGFGEPSAKAPIGAEYEDRSVLPPLRYRKTGATDTEWTLVPVIAAATTEEVNNGVSNDKMITPAKLSERLNDFASEIQHLPTQSAELGTAAFSLNADVMEDNSDFQIAVPDTSHATISAQILGYGQNAKLTNLHGGDIGQIVVIRRGESHSFQIESSQNIKLSSVMVFNDNDMLNNISLQRISQSVWVEVGRN